MKAIQHILFPVDFSERCEQAAPLVEALAKRLQARVTFLAVAQPLIYGGVVEPGAPILMDLDLLRASLQSHLDRIFPDRFTGVIVNRVSDLGDPAQVIVDFARNNAVDLILMPTHGYGPFRRLLLGSVTAKVLHDSDCPVWTEAHMAQPDIADHLETRTILCALDRSEKSAEVLTWAAEFAKMMGAQLRLAHAIPAVEAWPERQLDREFEESVRQDARAFFNQLLADSHLDVPLCIEAGDVARVVHEEARRHNADLIIIGRGVIHEKLGRLRTHAHSIIREAHCPVISV